jgi:phytoene dehydrogenase-like protein
LQETVGKSLCKASADVPRLPVQSASDVLHDLKILGVQGVLAGALSAVTVLDVLHLLGLDRDRPFCSLIAMLLQDTAQAGPETVPFANAAACLHAYRHGMSRPRGGMRALADGLGERLTADGGRLSVATLVDCVERSDPHGFVVVTRRRERIATRQVAFNLPIDLASRLLGKAVQGRLESARRRSEASWGAFTGYLAIDRRVIPDETPLFHQVLRSYDDVIHDGNNVLISLSPVEDSGYGPADVRVATLSTHVATGPWMGLEKAAYTARKAVFSSRLLAALGQAIPDAPGHLFHAEFATPRSFARYTRRTAGRVGGPPVSRRNANFLAVGSDILGSGVWLVGDSVFPGQGTMATVLSAIRVVERITGVSWQAIRRTGVDRPSISQFAGSSAAGPGR